MTLDQTVRDSALAFGLLSDETRLRILILLTQHSEMHVTDLRGYLSQSQPTVSHHLTLLRVSGLIESRRDGKHNYYSFRGDHFARPIVASLCLGLPKAA